MRTAMQKFTCVAVPVLLVSAKIERFRFRGFPFVSLKTRPGVRAFPVLAKAFREAAKANPPAQVNGFRIGFEYGEVRADASFQFVKRSDAAAVEAELSRFFATEHTHTGQPKPDIGARFTLSCRGGGSAATWADTFELFAAANLVPFTATGAGCDGEFFSFFEMRTEDFDFNPFPFLTGKLTELGFTAIAISAFSPCDSKRFMYDPAE
jgi:hypothetical protein